MPDTIIPVTYAGNTSYSLVFRQTPDGLEVRRSYLNLWMRVEDIKGSQLDAERMLVEINSDLKHGAPIYVWMRPEDWEALKRLQG